MKLSIVSPVYQAENIIPILVERIEKSVQKITPDYEIILVEDGSPDNSWDEIQKICDENTKIIGIQLSRNFGQHYAITAGLECASGDWIVVMDCDLQDLPEEIINLYNKALEGYDIILAKRVERSDGFFKKLGSKMFYKLFSYLTDTQQDSSVANFGIYNKVVIDSIKKMNDAFRVFPILVQWVGFKRQYLNVKHAPRINGKSSYTHLKLFKLAYDMIISFSDKPLRLGLKFGIGIAVISMLLSIYYLTLYFMGAILVPGYTSLILLVTFFSGIIISFMGLTGSYIGKIATQVKNRPKYIVKTRIN